MFSSLSQFDDAHEKGFWTEIEKIKPPLGQFIKDSK